MDTFEVIVRDAWCRAMGEAPADENTSWKDAGGDSLKIVEFLLALEATSKQRVPLEQVSEEMTLRSVTSTLRNLGKIDRGLAPPAEHRAKLFFAPGIGILGARDISIEKFARALANAADVQILQYDSIDLLQSGSDVFEKIVENFSKTIRQQAHDSPIVLVGYSYGGAVLFEAARRLEATSRHVDLLVLLDAEKMGAECYDLTGSIHTLVSLMRRNLNVRAALSYWSIAVLQAAARIGRPSLIQRAIKVFPQTRLSAMWRKRLITANMRASRMLFQFGHSDVPTLLLVGSYRNLTDEDTVEVMGWTHHCSSIQVSSISTPGHIDIVTAPDTLDCIASRARKVLTDALSTQLTR